jgi:tRNA (guanine-N7-)-methyltransferase
VTEPWEPPALLVHPGGDRVRGALQGSLLFEQPAHRATRDAVRSFVDPSWGGGTSPRNAPRVALEIGFDHGMRILDHARRFPEVRWLGLEIREARVQAAAPHAPSNCLLLRADARTVLAVVLPDACLDAVYILFPTPTRNPRHLLLTPGLVDDLARVVRPGGVVHLATDVEGYFTWASACFGAWTPADGPPWYGPVLSRRERVCKRDGLPVHRGTWAVPPRATPVPG